MKISSFVVLLALAALPFCTSLGKCSDKAIFKDYTNYELINNNQDKTLAYNSEASCYTLNSDSDGYHCCYVKVKFKNEQLDEKFTQKGCMEFTNEGFENAVVNDNDQMDFDDFKDEIETKIEQSSGVKVKSLSINCSSKFLHLAGIALLFFFL